MDQATPFESAPPPKHRVLLSRGRLVVSFAAAALYASSLLSNALLEPDGVNHVRGIVVLMTGWVGVLSLNLSWYANPLFFAAMGAQSTGKYKLAAGFAVAALALGLQSLAGFNGGGFFPSYGRQQLELGFYVWLAALFIFALWTVVALGISDEVEREGTA
jgi:hypothetical protein